MIHRILASSGANDGTIKLWDMRHSSYTGCVPPEQGTALQTIEYANNKRDRFGRGYHHLTFDGKGRLFAACSDQKIYCYQVSSSAAKPLGTFAGCRSDTFTRIDVADNWLMSGSWSGQAFVWDTDDMSTPNANRKTIQPKIYLPHFKDVSAIACDEATKAIYTCSDDRTLTKWTLYSERDSVIDRKEVFAQPFEAESVENNVKRYCGT